YLRAQPMAAKLPFADYMQAVLYHPQWGYYGSGQVQFGAGGDFVTAPERSPLFTLGLVFEWQQAQAAGLGDEVLELGAGSGQLALDFLQETERRGCCPNRYLILEISPALRLRQQQRLRAVLSEPLFARLVWLDSMEQLLPNAPRQPCFAGGMLIANEVLDAMPITRFSWRPGQLDTVQEQRVACDGARFTWVSTEPSQRLLHALRFYADQWPPMSLPEAPVFAEINETLADWLAALNAALSQAAKPTWAYFFDYGGTSSEVYRPDRTDGTLRCHYRHLAHDDPFVYPGLQDITTWVDFEHTARLAAAIGFIVDGTRSQAAWLLGTDVPDQFTRLMNQAADRATSARIAQGFKELVMPTEMGERFRVLRLRVEPA
ncbi:MAG: class I SAM-dependent methyltransferase, partial [Halothiobacillus sp.]